MVFLNKVIPYLFEFFVQIDSQLLFISFLQMDMDHIPIEFRATIVLLAFCNLLMSIFAESFVVDYLVFYKLKNTRFYRRFDTQRPMYESLRVQTADLQWLRNAAAIFADPSTDPALATTSPVTSNEAHCDLIPKSRTIGSPAGDSALSGHSSTALLICDTSKEAGEEEVSAQNQADASRLSNRSI